VTRTFSARDWLLLSVVVTLVAGWWVDEGVNRRLRRESDKLREENTELAWRVNSLLRTLDPHFDVKFTGNAVKITEKDEPLHKRKPLATAKRKPIRGIPKSEFQQPSLPARIPRPRESTPQYEPIYGEGRTNK
jgi:hypothetical protein